MKRMMHAKHGYCHAHTRSEEEALLKAGWVPDDGEALRKKLEAVADPEVSGEASGDEVAEVRAQLDALGIAYHHRAGLAKLKSLLPEG